MSIEKKSLAASVLTRLGILPNLKGYQYLVEATALWLEKRNITSTTSNFYEELAKKFSVSGKSIESSMRSARKFAQTLCYDEKNNILELPDGCKTSSLSNLQFIALVANRVAYA